MATNQTVMISKSERIRAVVSSEFDYSIMICVIPYMQMYANFIKNRTVLEITQEKCKMVIKFEWKMMETKMRKISSILKVR